MMGVPSNAFRKQLTSHSSTLIGPQTYNALCSFINWQIRAYLFLLIAIPCHQVKFLSNSCRKQLMSHFSTPLTPLPPQLQPKHILSTFVKQFKTFKEQILSKTSGICQMKGFPSNAFRKQLTSCFRAPSRGPISLYNFFKVNIIN